MKKKPRNSQTKQPIIVRTINDQRYAEMHSLVSVFNNLKTGKRDQKPWWEWGLGADGQLYCRGQISGWQLENWYKVSRGLQPLISAREIKLIYNEFFLLKEYIEPVAMPW